MGIGEAKDDSKILDKAQEELALISGQRAVKTITKKAKAINKKPKNKNKNKKTKQKRKTQKQKEN